MPKSVNIPGVGVVNFPDTMSNEQISSVISTKIMPKYGAVQAPVAPESPGTGRGGILASGAEAFLTGFTDLPEGIAGLMYARPEETTAGKFSQGARDIIQSTLGIDPTKEGTMAERGAQALGSLASFIVPALIPGLGEAAVGARVAGAAGAAGKAAQAGKILSRVPSVVQAVGLGAEQQIQAIKEKEKSGEVVPPEVRLASQRFGGVIGLADLLPLGRFIGPLEKILQKVPLAKSGLVSDIIAVGIKRAATSATAEGAQEAISQLGQNLVSKGYYDPDLDISQGLLGNAAAGGFAGGTFDVILQLMAGRKIRKAVKARKQLGAYVGKESAEAAPEIVRANELEGLDALRSAAPTGTFSMVQGIPLPGEQSTNTYHLVGEDGRTPLASFAHQESAINAGKQYEAESSGAAKFNPPTITELAQAKPIKKIKQTKAQKNVARQEAKRLAAAGQLTPSAATGPASTEEGFSTTVESIDKAVSDSGLPPSTAIDAPILAPRSKRKKKISPVELPTIAVDETVQPPISGLEAQPSTEAQAAPTGLGPVAVPETTVEPAIPAVEAAPVEAPIAPPMAEAAIAAEPAVIAPTVAPEATALPEVTAEAAGPAAPVAEPSVAPLPTAAEQTSKAQEEEAMLSRVTGALKSDLASRGLADIQVKLAPYLKQEKVYARGSFDKAGKEISLAYRIYDPKLTEQQLIAKLTDVMNHEFIHAVTAAKVLTDAEVKTLFDAVQHVKYPGQSFTYADRAFELYKDAAEYSTKNPDGTTTSNMEMIVEEAVADMYRDHMAGRLKLNDKPKSALGQITEFFKRLFRSYKAADVGAAFEEISSGRAGARSPRESAAINNSVQQSKRAAEAIAKTAEGKSGEALDKAAEDASGHVRNAVRRLSIIPTPAPMPSYFSVPNSTLFSPTRISTAPGEKFMDLFGGLGNSAGRTRMMEKFRVWLVQKEGQVEKIQRKAELAGVWEQGSAEYSAIASIEKANRASHYTVEVMESGAPVIKMINNDVNSKYFAIAEDLENSPKKVLEILTTGGPGNTALFDQFKTLAVARVSVKRMGEGKEVPLEVTPQYIQNAEALAVQFPAIQDAYERYQQFNKKLMQAAFDAGVIDQAGLSKFTDDMNYYSMYHEFDYEAVVPGTGGAVGKKIKVHKYKGGPQGNLISDPMVAIMHNVAFWTSAIMRNVAAQKAHRLAITTGIGQDLKWKGSKLGWEAPDVNAGFDPAVLSFFDNGKEVRYATKDALFNIGLASSEGSGMGTALELLGMPAGFLREMVTRDPGFMIANLLRDSISTWVVAGSGANPAATFYGMKEALLKGTSYQALKRFAVVGSFDEAQKSPRKYIEGLKRQIITVNGPRDATGVARAAWDMLGKVSEASDAATRIAVYEAAIKEGATEYTAAYRALSIMNFSRSGSSAGLKIFTKLIPFMNARIQGFDVLYKGLKSAVQLAKGDEQTELEKKQGAAVMTRGLMLTVASIMLAMLNEDDEDYKQLPSYIKDANLLIPIGEKKFIAIPSPFESGLLFSKIPTAMYEVLRGDRSTRDASKMFFQQLGSTFGFNPLPQFMGPGVENMINHDFYTGMPLVSPGQAQLAPELQYNASTSYTARGLSKLLKFPFGYSVESGKFENVSPIMIDNLITGYGGPIAGYLSMAVGGVISAFGKDGEGLPVPGSSLPVIKRFFIDAQDKQPKAVSDAYEVYQLVDRATRTINRLKKSGDVEAFKEYQAENRDLLRLGPMIRKMTQNLGDIRAAVRRLEKNTTMTGAEKIAKMRELRSREIQVTRRIDEINQKLGR